MIKVGINVTGKGEFAKTIVFLHVRADSMHIDDLFNVDQLLPLPEQNDRAAGTRPAKVLSRDGMFFDIQGLCPWFQGHRHLHPSLGQQPRRAGMGIFVRHLDVSALPGGLSRQPTLHTFFEGGAFPSPIAIWCVVSSLSFLSLLYEIPISSSMKQHDKILGMRCEELCSHPYQQRWSRQIMEECTVWPG